MYEACEALFCALADEAQQYTDWLALGGSAQDLQELVDTQVWGSAASSSKDDTDDSVSSAALAAEADDASCVAAWELNMKALKTAAYDLGRLPNEVSDMLAGMRFVGDFAMSHFWLSRGPAQPRRC